MAEVRPATDDELAKLDQLRDALLILFSKTKTSLDDAVSVMLNVIVVSNLDIAGVKMPSSQLINQLTLEIANMVESIPERYNELLERN